MSTITLLSTAALILGFGGIIPQIAVMLRKRCSDGQSAAAWAVGITVNLMMAYVNKAAFDADLLLAGNIIAGALCTAALACVLVFRSGRQPHRPGDATLVDLPTVEFTALRDAVLHADELRARRTNR